MNNVNTTTQLLLKVALLDSGSTKPTYFLLDHDTKGN